MRVLVVGGGALGSWLAGHLVLGGGTVTLVARGAQGEALARQGLTLIADGRARTLRLTVVEALSQARGEPFDLTLIAVKSYHSAEVAAELAELALSTDPGTVVSFQNGIGNEAVLTATLPGRRVLAATLTTGLSIGPAGTVSGAGGGAGLPACPEANDLARTLVAGGLGLSRYADPLAMKWSKLLLNLLGSASAALLGWSPQRIFAERCLFQMELDAWREALAVIEALGLTVVRLPGYPLPWMARAVRHVPAPALFHLTARRLGGARGGRLPGLAADLAAGRAVSEVTVLHGAVAESAQGLGIPSPVCAGLSRLVQAVATGGLPAAALADQPQALLAAVHGRSE